MVVCRLPNSARRVRSQQAVIAYTQGSAYAEHMEREKGTLTPGMLADLAAVSQDIFTVAPDKLPEPTSLLTIIGGAVLYDSLTSTVGHRARPQQHRVPFASTP